jgi:nitric oxide reductase NorE protein
MGLHELTQTVDAATGDRRTDRMPGHVPGEPGVWVFIFGDLMVFCLLFGVFVFYRAQDVELFAQSQATLNQGYGAFNTLLLLASSWFVVMGVDAARTARRAMAAPLLAGAFACGVGFGVVKFLEYGEKVRAGITLTTNDFYMYYYMLTGLHFVHVLIGLGVLAVMWLRVRRLDAGSGDRRMLESGASYWHMVDLLWIVLFPLIYLVK